MVAAGALSGGLGGRATASPAPVAPPPSPTDLNLPAHPNAEDLARVQRIVAGLAAKATAAASAVDEAAARQAYLAVQLGEARDAATATDAQLSAAVRTAYESAHSSPVLSFLSGASPADAEAEHLAQDAALHVDGTLVTAHQQARAVVARLAAGEDRAHQALLSQAVPVEAADEQANAVLDEATLAFAADQAALAALQAQRAALAAASEQIALKVTPVVSASGAAAAAAQAPILNLLEHTVINAIPAGFHDSGQRVTGLSSYYGAGFIGSPTSSGSPFDPNQLTAAMLAVPLGTLVHVITAGGGQVNVLVTDHGPYAGVGRVIDLSERAASITGVGLTPVTIEVLEPN